MTSVQINNNLPQLFYLYQKLSYKYHWNSLNLTLLDKDSLNMNKTDLINAIAEHANLTKAEAGRALEGLLNSCLLYTSPSPRDRTRSRMPSSA